MCIRDSARGAVRVAVRRPGVVRAARGIRGAAGLYRSADHGGRGSCPAAAPPRPAVPIGASGGHLGAALGARRLGHTHRSPCGADPAVFPRCAACPADPPRFGETGPSGLALRTYVLIMKMIT